MAEERCSVGQIEIAYDRIGDPSAPALLLVMGLGAPMVAWPQRFCEMLAARGFHVIRFDNRDVGHSTVLREAGVPQLGSVISARRSSASYSLSDMAADARGLLDTLEIDSAHVVGASMGGMIAQTLAIESPQRVRSLTSIMSTTGRRTVGRPHPRVVSAFLRRPPAGAAAEIEHFVNVFRLVGSVGPLFDEQLIRELAADCVAQGTPRSGTIRQLAAIMTAPDRTRHLRGLRMPALVMHGTADKLIHPSGGRATARAIPTSTYVEFTGMGHDMPTALWPQMVGAISDNAARS